MAALRGSVNTLQRTRYIFSEFSPSIMKTINESPLEYVNLMESLGFNGYVIDNETSATPVSYETLRSYDEGVHNIFWSRNKLS